jgi:hypothetical protein
MKQTIPKKLLNSTYRKELWDNSQKIIRQLEKFLPISSAHLLGSFTTKKKRPADVDFIILLRTKDKPKSKWSVDLVIAPENEHGNFVLEDAKKWMKQKYGAKKSAVIKLKNSKCAA